LVWGRGVRLLLDTHVLAWSFLKTSLLSPAAVRALVDPGNEVLVSIVSPWEIAIKVGAGKWPEAKPLIDNFEAELAGTNFATLPITLDHVRAAGLMQSPHRDPFDRLLAAQAQIEGLTLITADAKLAGLGAPVLW
jgi:PIN domain nuclease of toxin-antitoxin system